MRGFAGLAAAVAVIAYSVYLVTQNGQPVAIDLLFTSVAGAPAWSLLLVSFAAGASLTALVLSWSLLRLRLSVRRQTRRVTRLEQEVHGLRTLPLSPEEPAPSDLAREG